MRKLLALLAVAIVGAAGSLLAASPAAAHGYVSSPPSRQALCAQGVMSCGQIKYEPQSVEGPKGLKTCNANVAGFAELNDDSRGWPATSVSTSQTFTWVNTARHATANWEYWIGNTRVASFGGNNQQPPATLSHTVNLSGFSGRQKILAVWNISDTTNAFYSCIDVNIGGSGGGGTTPPPTGSCGGVAAWTSSTVYVGGNFATHNGRKWKASWWTQGETPGAAAVWVDQGPC
ncbi:chitin-binding protein [Actinoplanes lutulentus]|uniref:Chitin-binding protein n=1 Tax=Actinoplanes lutulentus TaxID=1287878 RepID=A0A327ZIT6_9ACTN|nr:lytic polysaccharide monooxygenase [Actinoplanes lutulentus]MBB2944178.1 chitin-binding protein [Actinoplanes lutulentus]RAK42589.1 chitin-binding protein [Actinoplanes lutulentus]